MWKLWIWPAICAILFIWNYAGTQNLLIHVDQCDMIGCAFAYFGTALFREMIIGSLVLYILFVALVYYYAKIKKQPVDYWLPVYFGPFTAPLALFLYFLYANLF